MFKDDTLRDKSVLITGGGSGLGFSMAVRFVQLGARVWICGRSEERLAQARAKINQAGFALETFVCDVRDYEAVRKMIVRIGDCQDGLNVLVNNAAGNFLAASEELSPHGFKTVVDIVLHGTFNCSQHFVRQLLAAGKKGSILNLVTTYAMHGSAFVLPSACAKAGVLAMTKSLAVEWAPYGIRVNAIAPGPFPTRGAWSRLIPDPKLEQQYLAKIPAGRYGNHDELADLAVFLISDLSPYMTGECVVIDGGESLQGGQFNFLTHHLTGEQLKRYFKKLRQVKA